MAGPHQDNGVPWTISASTATPNQVSPGHPSGAYNPNQNQPVVTTPPVVDTNQSNVGLGASVHGAQSYTPPPVPLKYTMEDVMSDLASTHGALELPSGEPTKYGLSYEGKTGQLGTGHTLGSFIAVDSSGNPILDSEGKPVFTGLGKHIHDDFQDKGYVGQNQYIDPSMMGELKDMVGQLSYEDLQEYESDFWRNYTAPGGEGGYEDYGHYDPQQDTFDLLAFLNAGLPQRQVDQQTFFNEMIDPYASDTAEALNKGIFSGAMGEGVMDPRGLKRLITSFGSGVTKPRYANVAKGGIIGLLGV